MTQAARVAGARPGLPRNSTLVMRLLDRVPAPLTESPVARSDPHREGSGSPADREPPHAYSLTRPRRKSRPAALAAQALEDGLTEFQDSAGWLPVAGVAPSDGQHAALVVEDGDQQQ